MQVRERGLSVLSVLGEALLLVVVIVPFFHPNW